MKRYLSLLFIGIWLLTGNAQAFFITSNILGVTTSVKGAEFDGANDYLSYPAGFSSVYGSVYLISFWIRTTSTSESDLVYNDDGILVRYLGTGKLQFTADNMSGTTVFSILTNTALNDGLWHHIAFKYNGGNASYQLYQDGAATLPAAGGYYSTGVMDFDATNWTLAANNNGSRKFAGSIAEFYFSGTSTDYDLSNSANLAKFIGGNAPAALGATCANPTGAQPFLCLSRDSNDAITVFATNKGTGAGMTINGTLTEPATSPAVGQ